MGSQVAVARLIAVASLVLLARASAQEAPHAASQHAAGHGWSDSLQLLVDRALVSSRGSDYERALAYIDRELARTPGSAVLHHYRGFALYRQASVMVATTPGDRRAKPLLEEANRALEASAALGWAETRALQSAVTGQLIAFANPFTKMRGGSKAQRFLDDAAELGPANPRVWMLRGVSFLFRPRLFGGGADKAERDLRRAIALFATDAPLPPKPWWGQAEAHGWLGESLARQGRLVEARAEFARALELEPGNAWVKDVLMPALDGRR